MATVSEMQKEHVGVKSGLELNEQQLKGVKQVGCLLLIAPPGSGKSTVLVARIHHLITERNVRASNILAFTFTRKAAEELKQRIHKMPGVTKMDLSGLSVCTIHSFCLRVLRASGYRKDILANNKKEALMYSILKEQRLQDEYAPEQLLQQLSYLKNMGLNVDELKAQSTRKQELLSVFKQYEHHNFAQNLADYDDLLLAARDLLREKPERRKMLQNQLKFILVDEAQDINSVQLDILKLLYNPGDTELFLVADPNQSIYSFRGATPGFLYHIQDHFADIQAKELIINYRNPKPIVDLANKISKCPVNMTPYNKEGRQPVLLQPNDLIQEAKDITRLIKEKHSAGQSLSDFCILSRTSEYLIHTFEELVLAGIPCYIATSRCLAYEKPYVKPLLDNLRLAIKPNSKRALQGMLQTLYIKKDMKEKINNNGRAQISLLEKLLKLPELEERQAKRIKNRFELLNSIKDKPPGDAIRACRESFFDRYAENGYRYLLSPAREKILETLDKLETKASRFKNLEEYLFFVDQVIHNYQQKEDKDQDRVSLLTIHAAKGLEFKTVFLVGAIETILPHRNAIEDEAVSGLFRIKTEEDPILEEARLLYVAVTRSTSELYITAPRQHKEKAAELSRFLKKTNIKRGDAIKED